MADRELPNSEYVKWLEEKAKSAPVYNPDAVETYLDRQPTRSFLLMLARETGNVKNPFKIYHLCRIEMHRDL
jgi:hypothetical protein